MVLARMKVTEFISLTPEKLRIEVENRSINEPRWDCGRTVESTCRTRWNSPCEICRQRHRALGGWYERVFGFKVTIGFKDEQGIVVARWAAGGPDRTLSPSARTRSCPRPSTGFDPVSFRSRTAPTSRPGRPTSTSRARELGSAHRPPSAYIVSSTTRTAPSCTSTPTARHGRTRSKPTSPGFRLSASGGQRGAGPHPSASRR